MKKIFVIVLMAVLFLSGCGSEYGEPLEYILKAAESDEKILEAVETTAEELEESVEVLEDSHLIAEDYDTFFETVVKINDDFQTKFSDRFNDVMENTEDQELRSSCASTNLKLSACTAELALANLEYSLDEKSGKECLEEAVNYVNGFFECFYGEVHIDESRLNSLM